MGQGKQRICLLGKHRGAVSKRWRPAEARRVEGAALKAVKAYGVCHRHANASQAEVARAFGGVRLQDGGEMSPYFWRWHCQVALVPFDIMF